MPEWYKKRILQKPGREVQLITERPSEFYQLKLPDFKIPTVANSEDSIITGLANRKARDAYRKARDAYNQAYNEYLEQYPISPLSGIGYNPYIGIQYNPQVKQQQAAHNYAVKESGYIGDKSTAPYKNVDDTFGAVSAIGVSMIPLLGASYGTFGILPRLATDTYFGYEGAKNLISPEGVVKTINFAKQGRGGRAILSGIGDLFDLTLARQGLKGIKTLSAFAKETPYVAKFNWMNRKGSFRMEYPWQRTPETLPERLTLEHITENQTPNYNPAQITGHFGKVKYYGPTMGKTTAAAVNSKLVDFDDIIRQSSRNILDRYGFKNKSEMYNSGNQEAIKAYEDMLVKSLQDWRANPENANLTLVASPTAIANPANTGFYFDNIPSIPSRDVFIARNVGRGGTPEASALWYDSLIRKNPNLKIDNRFVSQIESKPYQSPSASQLEMIPQAAFALESIPANPKRFASGITLQENVPVNDDVAKIATAIANPGTFSSMAQYGVDKSKQIFTSPWMRRRLQNMGYSNSEIDDYIQSRLRQIDASKLSIADDLDNVYNITAFKNGQIRIGEADPILIGENYNLIGIPPFDQAIIQSTKRGDVVGTIQHEVAGHGTEFPGFEIDKEGNPIYEGAELTDAGTQATVDKKLDDEYYIGSDEQRARYLPVAQQMYDSGFDPNSEPDFYNFLEFHKSDPETTQAGQLAKYYNWKSIWPAFSKAHGLIPFGLIGLSQIPKKEKQHDKIEKHQFGKIIKSIPVKKFESLVRKLPAIPVNGKSNAELWEAAGVDMSQFPKTLSEDLRRMQYDRLNWVYSGNFDGIVNLADKNRIVSYFNTNTGDNRLGYIDVEDLSDGDAGIRWIQKIQPISKFGLDPYTVIGTNAAKNYVGLRGQRLVSGRELLQPKKTIPYLREYFNNDVKKKWVKLPEGKGISIPIPGKYHETNMREAATRQLMDVNSKFPSENEINFHLTKTNEGGMTALDDGYINVSSFPQYFDETGQFRKDLPPEFIDELSTYLSEGNPGFYQQYIGPLKKQLTVPNILVTPFIHPNVYLDPLHKHPNLGMFSTFKLGGKIKKQE